MTCSDLVHCILLEAAYFRLFYQLHATRALGAYHTRSNVFSVDALDVVFNMVPSPVYEEASRFLMLIALVPEDKFSKIWLVFSVHYPEEIIDLTLVSNI